MTSLYNKFSYDPSFRAFHHLLNSLLLNHLQQQESLDHKFLLVSKYLKLSIVDYSSPQSEEDKIFYPLSDLIVDGVINKDKLDQITYDQIIFPSNLPETKWEVLIDCLKKDYRKGRFPKVFDPFFKWKFGEIFLEQISMEQVDAMLQKVSEMLEAFEEKHPGAYAIHDDFVIDDPWQSTRGFGEDKCMVAYLQYLDDKLVELKILISQLKRAQC